MRSLNILLLSVQFPDAKALFTRIVVEGNSIPCDIGSGIDPEQQLPQWFDEAKFKRGQKFYLDNRFGIVQTNLCGLISLLHDPKGLSIIHNTGRSSTAETARKRYMSTILHVVSWFELDLSPGSKSWTSLHRVRKMHLNASTRSQKKNIGIISQTDMALVLFGFLGYALIRPHHFGICSDNDDDREAFVHAWAVFSALLGVHDRFNICLSNLPVVEMVFKIFHRYIIIPIIQVELSLVKSMVQAMVDGLSEFIPFNSYESSMYFIRRVAGVPGYQYNVDLEKETICRKLFSKEDIINLRKSFEGNPEYANMEKVVIDDRILVIKVKNIDRSSEPRQNNSSARCVYTNLDYPPGMREFLEIKHNQELSVLAVENEDDWVSYLSDSKLKSLSTTELWYFKFKCLLVDVNHTRIGRFVNETALSWSLHRMRKALNHK